MRVLLIEDDLQLGAALTRALEQEQFQPTWVRRLKEAHERIADGTTYAAVVLDLSLPDGEGTEILSALRGTAERLERERRFFADAAHELRTPLAVLSAQAHVVANESDPARKRDSLAALEAGIDRAARVVQRLLTLARLDAARPSDPF